MRLLALTPLLLSCALAAEVCPAPEGMQSAAAAVGRKRCVVNRVEADSVVEWQAAGIERAAVAGRLEVAVCCFRHESAAPEKLRIGGREITVETHREEPKSAGKEEEDEFPDLIEEDAHGRAISIRGTLAGGVLVDVLLRCTASKFADQFAFQFTVINRSQSRIEIDWDHLRILRAEVSPSVQPVASGAAYVFLTPKRPREAIATVELKRGNEVLGRFHFDGFALAQ
jgi:hypothetical protein